MYSGVDIDNIIAELRNLPVETLETHFNAIHGYETSDETVMHILLVYEFNHIANVLETINDECFQKLRVGSVLSDTFATDKFIVSHIYSSNGKITSIDALASNGYAIHRIVDEIYIEGGSHDRNACSIELTDEFIDINSVLNKLKELEDKDR